MADDIFQQFRNSSGGGTTGNPPATSGASGSGGGSIFQQFRDADAATTKTKSPSDDASGAITDPTTGYTYVPGVSDKPGAASRIIEAGVRGYKETPPWLSPEERQREESTWIGKYVTSPVNQVVGAGMGVLGGIGAAAQQGLYEGGEQVGNALQDVGIGSGGPRLGRDVATLGSIIPMLMGMTPNLLERPQAGPPSPRFVQHYYAEGTPANPLGSETLAQRAIRLTQEAGQDRSAMPPGTAPGPPPAAPPPAFVPPGTSAYPLGTPRAVDAGPRAANPLAYGTPGEGGEAAMPPAPNALDVNAPPAAPAAPPPVATTPSTGPSGRVLPITTEAQADAEADRILQHFAGTGSTTINSAPLASGAKPTLSQSIEGGNAGIAGLERGVRDVPEQNPHFVAQEQANTNLRNQEVGKVIGDKDATDVKEAALDAETGPKKDAIFANRTPTDPSPAVAKIDQILASEKGQIDAIKIPLQQVRAKLVDADGNMQTDALQLYGIDRAIRYMTGPKAAGTAADGRAAAYELGQVTQALRPSIEAGAPGFTKHMADQAARRSEIDGERWLQARNITDRNGNVNLGQLDTTIKALEKQQALPGARLADGVTLEQLARLKELREDYQTDAKQRLGVSLGSPTVQKLGVSGSMGALGHPLLAGVVGYGGGLAAGVAASNPITAVIAATAAAGFKYASARGQRMVMDALRRKLLDPDAARGAFTKPGGGPSP